MNELWQGAEIAMNMIAQVCKKQETKPLIIRLMNMDIQNVDSNLLKKKKEMFITGVPINIIIFNQIRITQTLEKKNKQQYFCFYPTTIVTSPIFN